MNVGIYQGSSAISSLERWQNVISQNIASATVPGFKASQLSFEGVAYGQLQEGTGSKAKMQSAVMPTDSIKTSFDNGGMRQTTAPTDLAIEGEGFFSVQDANGKTIYTRDGEFGVNTKNQLVNKSGYAVQGAGGSINLLPGQDMTVDPTGKIYQNNQLVGKVKVTEFTDKSVLQRVGGGFVTSDGSTGTTMDNPTVSQGYLEESNVSAVSEMVKLIQVQRAQEANQKAIQAYDDRLSRVVQTFNR